MKSKVTWLFLVPAIINFAVLGIGALKGRMEPVNITFGASAFVFLILAIMIEAKARKDSGTSE